MNRPLHPFIDYHKEEQHSTTPETPQKQSVLTKELLQSLQLRPISHQEVIEKKKQQAKKPKQTEDTKEKQYPKIRVSLNVMNQLKNYQTQLKCKSYCEVVMKLIEYYEGHDISTVNKSDDQ